MHHQPGRAMHKHPPTCTGAMPDLTPGTSTHPGWLPGPRAPELVPWARGTVAESASGCHQPGKLWCEREMSPPALAPGAGSAESRWGKGAASSRPTAGMWGGLGHPGPSKRSCEGPSLVLGVGPVAQRGRGHTALGGLWTETSCIGVKSGLSRDRLWSLLE